MENIILIGMPAVGKSTVGVVVAKRLGYKFIDTDLLIQEKEGKLLREIIAEKGVEGFLEVEDRVNASIDVKKTVVSPGGSVVYCENAMKHFKEIGTVIYLQASFETISKRLGNAKKRGVVLRDGQTLEMLYNERVKLFEKYADITVCEDGLRLEETIGKVLDILEENFVEFLQSVPEGDLKKEYLLPSVVDAQIQAGKAEVSVLETKDRWFGVTYKEDKPFVMKSFQALVDAGVYKEKLFS